MTTLFDVISWIETKGRPGLIRFEPSVYRSGSVGGTVAQRDTLARIQSAHGGGAFCTAETAKVIYSASFGAVQIMGFNLYGPNLRYGSSVAHFLNSPSDQADTFTQFLHSVGLGNLTVDDLIASANDRLNFAMKYNGAMSYAQSIVEALAHYGLPAQVTNVHPLNPALTRAH